MARPLTESEIRQIVRQEMDIRSAGKRFGITSIDRHIHNGINSPRINQNEIVPAVSVFGSITFANITTYTLNLNASFTPSQIFAYGNVVNSPAKYFFFGMANLTPSFYFQPGSSTSVNTGNIQYPGIFDTNISTPQPAQTCTYFGAEGPQGTLHTSAGQGHIIDVSGFPSSGDVTARATVTSFSKSAIQIQVTNLLSGWEINTNFVVT